MSVYKRCGCDASPNCKHQPLWLKIWYEGRVVARGPVQKFARHLVGEQKLPTTVGEAKLLEAAATLWYAKGCPPFEVTPEARAVEAAARRFTPTYAEYRKRHLDKMAEGASRALAFEARWKSRPLAVVLDQPEVEDYFDDRRDVDEIAAGSINREITRLAHFINWCRGRKYLAVGDVSPFYHRINNPTGIKKETEGARKRRLALADPTREAAHERLGEEDRIIKGIEQLQETGEEMRGRFYCAVDAGLRKGEMLALERADVLWQHRDGLMLRVRWETAKTKRERLVPVVTERLEDFLRARRFAPFPFGDGEGARIYAFQTAWDTVRERARLVDLRWHDLRHECGSRFAEGFGGRPPVPVRELMELMGHTNLATTQRYLNPTLSSLAANMRRAVGRDPLR